ncbi:MAG: hypothetical protein H6722_10730 [Sandaracinus sp.]|nr:hypothetical protein [Sandaracinus sp.]
MTSDRRPRPAPAEPPPDDAPDLELPTAFAEGAPVEPPDQPVPVDDPPPKDRPRAPVREPAKRALALALALCAWPAALHAQDERPTSVSRVERGDRRDHDRDGTEHRGPTVTADAAGTTPTERTKLRPTLARKR